MHMILIRHGTAFPASIHEERPLTEEGRSEAEATGRFLKEKGVAVAHIYHSPKLRAVQTAEITGKILNPEAECTLMEGLLPNDDTEPLLRQINTWDESAAIVGHLPFLAYLLARMTGDDEPDPKFAFHPGSAAVLEKEDGQHWEVKTFINPENIPQ